MTREKEPIEVPVSRLSDAALDGLIEELVTREGTEYGAHDHSLETKKRQVARQIERGEVIVLFDPESESCTLDVRRR